MAHDKTRTNVIIALLEGAEVSTGRNGESRYSEHYTYLVLPRDKGRVIIHCGDSTGWRDVRIPVNDDGLDRLVDDILKQDRVVFHDRRAW